MSDWITTILQDSPPFLHCPSLRHTNHCLQLATARPYSPSSESGQPCPALPQRLGSQQSLLTIKLSYGSSGAESRLQAMKASLLGRAVDNREKTGSRPRKKEQKTGLLQAEWLHSCITFAVLSLCSHNCFLKHILTHASHNSPY